MKKIFVTGGAGFIGSWVTKVLLDDGYDVTVFDNLSRGHQETVDNRAQLIKGDLADQSQLEEVLPGHDAVIHMGSFIEVAESVQDPVAFAENNVVNAVKLLEAMRKSAVKTIVFSSSATVYGIPQRLPIVETDQLGIATNPYGASKVAVEFFCQVYYSLYQFNVTLLRYFNPYGPGERHQPETHAIPNFVQAALANKPLPLYWKGEMVRDFIYIEDLAHAHTAVLSQVGYNIYNVGTKQGVKVKDVITLLSEILGKDLPIEDLGERKGDVMANYASFQKLKKATGWRPQVDLKEGLKRTVAYYQNHPS